MSIKYKDQTIAGRTIAYLPGADVYSTEETVVGRWIDGKPIYRKPYIATVTSTTTTTIADLAELNIDRRIAFYGAYSMVDSSGNSFRPIAYQDSVGVGKGTTLLTYTKSGSATYDINLTIIIEYTKTTDEATIAIPTTTEMTSAYEEGVQSA